jgi:hypothetical protein
MEHIRLGRKFHLVARAQVICNQENALRKFFIPIICQRIAHRRPLDAPTRTRTDPLVKIGNRRNTQRVKLQQFQSTIIFTTDMLKQIGTMNSSK